MGEEEKIIYEFESLVTDWIFRVVESFWLRVVDGPPIPINCEQLVRLKPETARLLFYNEKIEPHDPGIPEKSEYEALHSFTLTDEDGKWVHIDCKDRVELDRKTALGQIREINVKPIDNNIFWPWEV